MNNRPIYGITHIDDQPWIVTLPDGGSTREEAEQSEFAQMVALVGPNRFHCEMASWCSNCASETRWDEEGEGIFWRESGPVSQHDGSKGRWDIRRENSRNYGTGFRPVLIPADPATLQPDPARLSGFMDGDIIRMGTLYMNGAPVVNPTDPIGCGQPKFGMFGPPEGNVCKYTDGAVLHLGNTHNDPGMQINFIKLGDRLVSDRVILGCVSMNDLETQLKLEPCVLTPSKENTPDGPIELWARLGICLSVTPQELDLLRGEKKTAQELLIRLIQSDRCTMYGDTYFPEPANEKYLAEDLNFELPERPLRAEQIDMKKEGELPAFDLLLSDAHTRSASAQSAQNSVLPKTPGH